MKKFAVFAFAVLLSLPLLAAEPPAMGSAAPAFSLPNQAGAAVSLDQYKGKWVVLYFYPKDFTSGCTVEAHNFQRDIDKYKEKNAEIVGVSVDTADSHKGFCDKEALKFTLLADTTHGVSEKYGSTMEYNGNVLSARNTFLIDPTGVIRKVYVKAKPPDLAQLQAATASK